VTRTLDHENRTELATCDSCRGFSRAYATVTLAVRDTSRDELPAGEMKATVCAKCLDRIVRGFKRELFL
jgi:hypothetical protein